MVEVSDRRRRKLLRQAAKAARAVERGKALRLRGTAAEATIVVEEIERILGRPIDVTYRDIATTTNEAPRPVKNRSRRSSIPIGFRTPSIKKRIRARTTGRAVRAVKRAVNPLYGVKGMGFIKNPKRAVRGAIYKRTTFKLW